MNHIINCPMCEDSKAYLLYLDPDLDYLNIKCFQCDQVHTIGIRDFETDLSRTIGEFEE